MKARLIQDFDLIKESELAFRDQYNPAEFIDLFSCPEIKSSTLIWNNESRRELLNALKSLKDMDLENFEYTFNKQEIIVGEIYIGNYVEDDRSDIIEDVTEFAFELITSVAIPIIEE